MLDTKLAEIYPKVAGGVGRALEKDRGANIIGVNI